MTPSLPKLDEPKAQDAASNQPLCCFLVSGTSIAKFSHLTCSQKRSGLLKSTVRSVFIPLSEISCFCSLHKKPERFRNESGTNRTDPDPVGTIRAIHIPRRKKRSTVFVLNFDQTGKRKRRKTRHFLSSQKPKVAANRIFWTKPLLLLCSLTFLLSSNRLSFFHI